MARHTKERRKELRANEWEKVFSTDAPA